MGGIKMNLCERINPHEKEFPFTACDGCENFIIDDGLITCRLSLENMMNSQEEIKKDSD